MFTARKSSLNTSKYTYECTETGKIRVYRSQKLSKHIENTYECTETGKVRVYRSQKLSKHIEIHVRVLRNRQSTCLQVAKAL